MAFDFDSNADQIAFRMFSRVIKQGGVWEKQGQRYAALQRGATRDDQEFLLSHFGVAIKQGQVVATVHAHTSWASYGSRSIIPQLFMFVLDDVGVVAKYKIRGKGNLKQGWRPDASKTELKWQRDADARPAQWMTELAEQQAKDAETKAQAEPAEAPQGRCQVEGVVLAVKEQLGHYGYQTKMLVKLADGARVYGTVPSRIADDISKGSRVQFTANFARKEQEFAFYSRPSKAVLLQAAG